ncbi:MAG: hypothetical protein EPN91_13100 [Salinibacterium sp.]|nr:MAG: hypothetical protein EPN91_13100 [Salinibacterium sp.]
MSTIAGRLCCGAVFRRVGSESAGQTCILEPDHDDPHAGLDDLRDGYNERRRHMSDNLQRLVECAIAEQTRPGAGNETPPTITVSQWTPATRILIADVLVNAKALLGERAERRRLADALALAAPAGVGDDFDRIAELVRLADDADQALTMERKRSMWARDMLVDALPRPKEPPVGGDLEHMIERTVAELARRKTEVHDWRNRAGGLMMTMEVALLQLRAIQAGLVESGSDPDVQLDQDIQMVEQAIAAATTPCVGPTRSGVIAGHLMSIGTGLQLVASGLRARVGDGMADSLHDAGQTLLADAKTLSGLALEGS